MPRPIHCCRSAISAILAIGALASVTLLVPARALAQAGATGTLGTGSGPIMSRDELRACLRTQEDLNQRARQMAPEVDAIGREKAAIEAEREALKAAREEVERVVRQFNAQVDSINAQRAAFAAKVADWEQRRQAVESGNRLGRAADRQRQQLQDELKDLNREREALNALSVDDSKVRSDAATLDARSEALNRRIAEWNARNAMASDQSVKLTDERELWTIECGNRRYLTDDEKAIRSGQ